MAVGWWWSPSNLGFGLGDLLSLCTWVTFPTVSFINNKGDILLCILSLVFLPICVKFNWGRRVYKFPFAFVTNYHKFTGLRQCTHNYNLVSLEIRSWNGSYWAKISKTPGCIFSGGSGGIKNPFSCLFQSLEATHIPWLMVPFSIFKSISVASSKLFLTLNFCLPLPFFKDSRDHTGPTLIFQDNLLISRALTKSLWHVR